MSNGRLARILGWAVLLIGVLDIISVGSPGLPRRLVIIDRYLPYTFINATRYFSLLSGFFLTLLSLQLFKRKAVAWYATVILLVASILTHLFKGFDWRSSLLSVVALIFLIPAKSIFTVRYDPPVLRRAIINFFLIMAVAILYGVLGFYFIKKRHFGQTFSLTQSVTQVTRMFLEFAPPPPYPHTRFGNWFIDSIYVLGFTSLTTAVLQLIKPVAEYALPGFAHRQLATSLLSSYAVSPIEYFKIANDKQLFFSPQAFLAYRVSRGVAIVLGGPVAASAKDSQECVHRFQAVCRENDWLPVFYQLPQSLLPLFSQAGYRHIHFGDEAIIKLPEFTLDPELRSVYRKIQKQGYIFHYLPAPNYATLIAKLKEVSDEWLSLPNRSERGFAQGQFSVKYLTQSDLAVVKDRSGQVVAFVNLIPSFSAQLNQVKSVDLIRQRSHLPNGIMEFLWLSLILDLQKQLVQELSLGMGLAGESSHIKKNILQLLRVFRAQSLSFFKQKFHPHWQPYYLVYKSDTRLPQIALAILDIVHYKGDR